MNAVSPLLLWDWDKWVRRGLGWSSECQKG